MLRFRASRLRVADVMSTKPITVEPTATVKEVAKLMAKHDVGSILIVLNGKPVGIITEKDMVSRVIAKGRDASNTTAAEIMSSPVITITPNIDIGEAARKMGRLNIRRLAVMEGGRLAGIVTSRDILSVAPQLMEIIAETAAIMGHERFREEALAGYCDNCKGWSDELREVDGQFLCEECRLELGITEA